MIRQNRGFLQGDATLRTVQDRSSLHGLASLCQRARHARRGHGPHGQPPHNPLDDGQGDSSSTPAS